MILRSISLMARGSVTMKADSVSPSKSAFFCSSSAIPMYMLSVRAKPTVSWPDMEAPLMAGSRLTSKRAELPRCTKHSGAEKFGVDTSTSLVGDIFKISAQMYGKINWLGLSSGRSRIWPRNAFTFFGMILRISERRPCSIEMSFMLLFMGILRNSLRQCMFASICDCSQCSIDVYSAALGMCVINA